MEKIVIDMEKVENGEISKQMLKKHVRDVAFGQLRADLSKGTKASTIKYDTFQMQEYLRSDRMNKEEIEMLTNIRSSCVRGVKANFKGMHKVCLHCPLQCDIENPQIDTQEHVLKCSKLGGSTMDIILMHASSVEQSQLAKVFSTLMTRRTTLLEEMTIHSSCCRPGAPYLDPSSTGAPATIVPLL